jgi:hypothetical protein
MIRASRDSEGRLLLDEGTDRRVSVPDHQTMVKERGEGVIV